MAVSSIPLLYNPRARRGAAAHRIKGVIAAFADSGVVVTAIPSTAGGDIERKARELSDQGAPRLLLGGGDGSVHEAVNGLMRSKTPAALGLIPLGTGNDFAKANGIPLQPADAVAELAVRLASDAAPRVIDVGRLNERYFANGAGIGFDAKISAIASSIQLPIGVLVYPAAVVRGLVDGVVTPRMKMQFDGRELDAQLTLASFNIGQWVGGMFRIAPMARNDDGMLDLVYVDQLTRRQIVPLVPKLLRGTHMSDARVHHELIAHCRIEAEAKVPAHLDGENQAPQRHFDIGIVAGALRLL
ncbi:MAG: YegS/Rv2252/BmrU family lipid kinase [Woeseia sp.]